jgi:hypothetical protein
MSQGKPTLAGLQQAFQAYVHQPEKLAGIVDGIQSDARLPAEERLGIYERAYRLRLQEALTGDYPGLRALAGDEDFESICLDYIAAQPSTFYNMRWFGGTLPQFLRESGAWRDVRMAAEMADFEWALVTAFDAPNDPVLQVDEIGKVAPDDWPEMRFQPHASVQRVDMQWQIVPVWQAAKDEVDAEVPERNEEPTRWIIWRSELKTLFRSMEADEAAAFDALRVGACFAEICQLLMQWHEEGVVAGRAATLLKQWTLAGMLTTMTVD